MSDITTMNNVRKIGPRSRAHRFAMLDGRTREAQHMKVVRAELTEHVGGRPDAVQRLLIARLATVSLRLTLYDEKFATGQAITDFDSRVYAALHTQFRLMLREISLEPSDPRRVARHETTDDVQLTPAEAYRRLIHG